MKIVHKEIAPGWHALRVVDDNDKFIKGVGVMLEGTYPTQVHQSVEQLHFLKGSVTIDGRKCGLAGQYIDIGRSPTFVVQKGPAIYFRTK